jgi:Fe-S-cluster containining protein
MDTKDTLKFKCVHCGNCCFDPKIIVNLSYRDILRIKNGLDLSLDELLEIVGFYIFNDKLDKATKEKMVIPPLKTERGLSYIALLKNKTGACIFYDFEKKRCRIYQLRPNFCRTFPFFFYSTNKENSPKLNIAITEKGKEECLGLSEDAPPINESQWFSLGKDVLEDLKLNANFINQINLLVKKKKMTPSAKESLRKIIELGELMRDQNNSSN